MATLVDAVQLALEESPRYEGAVLTTPYRVSSVNVSWIPAQAARIMPSPQFIDRSDEMRGIEGGVPQLVESFEPEGNVTMRAYLNSIVWFLQTLGLTDTVTAGNGVITDPDAVVIPTGAFRHVFTKRGGITAKTMQLILAYVDEGVFLKGQGFGTTNLTLNAEGALSADMQGLVVARIADPNLAPALDASSIPHIRRGDLTLTWLTGSGTTEDFSVAIANPLNRRRTLSLATPSNFPDVMEHADDRVRLTGSIPKTVLDPDDYDALVAGTTFVAKARWKSPAVIGATAYKYSMWIEMAKCQYTEGQPATIGNQRRFGMDTLNFWAAWDEGAGYDFKITVVNAISAAALETLV